MTKETLVQVMLYQLEAFNRTGLWIDSKTIHNTIIADDDGLTASISSASLYKAFVQYSIVKSGLNKKKWPTNWIKLPVNDLAGNLLP